MMNKKVFLINFDKPLPEKVNDDIRAEYTDIEELIIINKKISINLRKRLYLQCIDIRAELERDYKDIFSGHYPVILNLPGFSIAAVYLVNELEAKMKQKPLILEMIKHKDRDSLFPNFEYRRILDLSFNYKVTKNNSDENYT